MARMDNKTTDEELDNTYAEIQTTRPSDERKYESGIVWEIPRNKVMIKQY